MGSYNRYKVTWEDGEEEVSDGVCLVRLSHESRIIRSLDYYYLDTHKKPGQEIVLNVSQEERLLFSRLVIEALGLEWCANEEKGVISFDGAKWTWTEVMFVVQCLRCATEDMFVYGKYHTWIKSALFYNDVFPDLDKPLVLLLAWLIRTEGSAYKCGYHDNHSPMAGAAYFGLPNSVRASKSFLSLMPREDRCSGNNGPLLAGDSKKRSKVLESTSGYTYARGHELEKESFLREYVGKEVPYEKVLEIKDLIQKIWRE